MGGLVIYVLVFTVFCLYCVIERFRLCIFYCLSVLVYCHRVKNQMQSVSSSSSNNNNNNNNNNNVRVQT